MTEFQTLEVPFETVGNRRVITDLAIAEMPWLIDFIKQFPLCFERSAVACYWIFYSDGDAPLKTAE